MSTVRSLAIVLVGMFFALALTVFVPCTEAQSVSGDMRAAPPGQYTLARWRRHHHRHHRRHHRHTGAIERRMHPGGIVTA
jgi:hypothetical protein